MGFLFRCWICYLSLPCTSDGRKDEDHLERDVRGRNRFCHSPSLLPRLRSAPSPATELRLFSGNQKSAYDPSAPGVPGAVTVLTRCFLGVMGDFLFPRGGRKHLFALSSRDDPARWNTPLRCQVCRYCATGTFAPPFPSSLPVWPAEGLGIQVFAEFEATVPILICLAWTCNRKKNDWIYRFPSHCYWVTHPHYLEVFKKK